MSVGLVTVWFRVFEWLTRFLDDGRIEIDSNGVEPLGYLTDILTRIVNGHPNSQIDDLLPWALIRPPKLKAVA